MHIHDRYNADITEQFGAITVLGSDVLVDKSKIRRTCSNILSLPYDIQSVRQLAVENRR